MSPDQDKLISTRRALRLTPTRAAELCGLHRTTISRMESGATRIHPTVLRYLELMAGQLPGDWNGWTLTPGEIWSPESRAFTPGELRALEYHYQKVAALEATIADLQRPGLTDRLQAALGAFARPGHQRP